MEEFTGRVAVVTGAGSGMGKAFALRWAAEGMKVVAADIQRDALDATVAELTAAGHEAIGVPTDVSSLEAIRNLATAAMDTYGGIHLVNNNAGVEGYLDGPIWEATEKDWTWTVGVNFWSAVYGVQTFVPLMLAGGEPGHVVNTCSMTSVITAGNMYGITKHGVLALTEVLRQDLKARDALVSATALCPGTIATNLFHGSRNRPHELENEVATSGADQGRELREQMHAVLATGMSPAQVAELLVTAVRTDAPYLLTDHEWDDQIIARHQNLLAGAVGPLAGATSGGN